MPDLRQSLVNATKDLTYTTESDARLDVIWWPPAPSARAAVETNGGHEGPIEERSAAEFFDGLASVEGMEGFAALRKLMESSLKDLTVIRQGEIEIEVYVLGRASTGEWAGFHTHAVET